MMQYDEYDEYDIIRKYIKLVKKIIIFMKCGQLNGDDFQTKNIVKICLCE